MGKDVTVSSKEHPKTRQVSKPMGNVETNFLNRCKARLLEGVGGRDVNRSFT